MAATMSPESPAQRALKLARLAQQTGSASDMQKAGLALLDMVNKERENAFAMGWNARQRLGSSNVVPTKSDYSVALEAAKKRWSAE